MKPETKQLLKNLGLGLGLLSVVGLLLWGAWHVVRLPVLTIDQVAVTGGETISHESIQVDVEELLQGEYWRFIPRSFVWTYPRIEIIEQISATPRVKDPEVVRRGRLLQVTLAEFQPTALWCDSESSTTSTCVFLDDHGYGFAQAPVLTGGSFTRFSRVGESATTSAVFADATDFSQLQMLQQLLDQAGFTVSRIELDTARDAFVHLTDGGELKVSLQLSPEDIIDNLQTVLAAQEYQHLEPGNFSYIDLRFGNKVFVNEFGEPELETETAASSTEDTAGE